MKIIRILLLLVLAGLAAYSIYYRHQKWAEGRYTAGDRAQLPVWKPEEVRGITVSWRNFQTDLSFENNLWRVKQRGGAVASTHQVVSFLNVLSNLNPLKELTPCGEEMRHTLRLMEKESDSEIPGVVVTLRDADGKTLFYTIFGKGHFTKKDAPVSGYETQSADGRYILVRDVSGKDRVFLVSQLFEGVQPAPRTWVEQMVMNQPELALGFRLYELKSDGSEENLWSLIRPNLTSPFLVLAPRDLKKQPDMNAVSKLASLMAQPFSVDRAEAGAVCTPSLAFELIEANGFTYTVLLDPKNLTAKLNSRFDSSRLRRLPDETEEQLQMRRSALQNRAAHEAQVYENAVFTITRNLVDLLKTPPLSEAQLK